VYASPVCGNANVKINKKVRIFKLSYCTNSLVVVEVCPVIINFTEADSMDDYRTEAVAVSISKFTVILSSVADPDPYVFGPPGSGSISTR
jgi:hypothetical protein